MVLCRSAFYMYCVRTVHTTYGEKNDAIQQRPSIWSKKRADKDDLWFYLVYKCAVWSYTPNDHIKWCENIFKVVSSAYIVKRDFRCFAERENVMFNIVIVTRSFIIYSSNACFVIVLKCAATHNNEMSIYISLFRGEMLSIRYVHGMPIEYSYSVCVYLIVRYREIKRCSNVLKIHFNQISNSPTPRNNMNVLQVLSANYLANYTSILVCVHLLKI